MLRKLEDLPANILGVTAEGKVTRGDYESVLVPLLEEKQKQGAHVRFLYQLGPAFEGFNAGAAVDDLMVGVKYFRLFEKCAVVSDKNWLQKSVRLMNTVMPFPLQIFGSDQLGKAVDWLESEDTEAKLKFDLKDNGVLILHPEGPLRRQDFDKVTSIVDPWIESHHMLQGIVVSTKNFPGWENLGSLIHHIDFVSSHHQKVKRVAMAVDGQLPALAAKIVPRILTPEFKQFSFRQLDKAILWAEGK